MDNSNKKQILVKETNKKLTKVGVGLYYPKTGRKGNTNRIKISSSQTSIENVNCNIKNLIKHQPETKLRIKKSA